MNPRTPVDITVFSSRKKRSVTTSPSSGTVVSPITTTPTPIMTDPVVTPVITPTTPVAPTAPATTTPVTSTALNIVNPQDPNLAKLAEYQKVM